MILFWLVLFSRLPRPPHMSKGCHRCFARDLCKTVKLPVCSKTKPTPNPRNLPVRKMKPNDALALIILAYVALSFLVCFCIIRFALAIRRHIHGSTSTASTSLKSTSSTGSAANYGNSETSESSTSTPGFEPATGPLPPAPPPVGSYPYPHPPPPVGLGGTGYVPGTVPPPPPPAN